MATATVEEGIIERLRGDANITALVGSSTAARISHEFPSQDSSMPYITISRVNSDYRHHIAGTTSKMRADIQIDSFAKTFDGAHALADLVRARLNTFQGTITVGSDSIVVDHCYINSDNTGFLATRGGMDARVKRVSHDYTVWVGVS